MFIKIENNILTDWADWEFEGSKFVDIDYEVFRDNPDRFTVKDNELVDLSDTNNYQMKKRKEEIEDELNQIDLLFYQASQAPVEFEGHLYKFDWTSLYQGILNSGILPAKIWDLTELEENAVMMDKQKLQELQNTLLEIQETAFQTKKEARSILLNEKAELERLMEE